MKSPEPLWKISVATTAEAEDAVTELLANVCSCAANSYFDARRGKVFVSVFLSEPISHEIRGKISNGLKRIKNCGLQIGAGKISAQKLRRQDWAESWKRHFQPLEIGKSLLIKPSWDKKLPRKNQAAVILDPGLSFGTGQHPTTAFCLKEIVRQKIAAKSFLDLGTGSGILAIAAAKLGCRPVRAIDFDPDAVRIAKANAKANGVLSKIQFVRGNVSKLGTKPVEKFDLVCANLISDLLIAEREKIVAQMKIGGVLVLAGILKTEFSRVQKVFETVGLKLISARTEKEWRSGSFKKF